MKPTSDRWVSLGEPASAAEAAALNRFRELLPDDGVTRAWSNLTFLDTNGRSAEVDVLLLSPVGFFVVELKGWFGTITGDQQTWEVKLAEHLPSRFERNPYFLADSKAKRLASLLKQTAPRGHEDAVPFVQAAIVLHGRDSTIELDQIAASHVLALDGYNVTGLPDGATLSEFLATPPRNPRHQITPQQAEKIAALVAAAGFVPRPRTRTYGRYILTSADPIASGKGWHDHLATHPDVLGLQRRVRIFDLPEGASRADRDELERLAQREFSLTRGIRHAGIEAPVEFVRTDSGPALIFDHDERALRLEEYLTRNAQTLTFANRLALIRQIAEVMAYAHSRRLTHRALSPERVRVTTVDGAPQVRIRDWMTGRRTEASTAQPTLTVLSAGVGDVAGLLDFTQWVYLAPESIRGTTNPPPVPLDVYGLGTLAYLIVTGQPPAKDIAELQTRVNARQAIDAAAIRPDLPEPLVTLIQAATNPNELDRPATAADFLDQLAKVVAATAPPAVVVAPPDPLEAEPDSVVGGRFKVRARRGTGSTGVALLVDDPAGDHEGVVLKVARDDAAATRLDAEAVVLATLDHPRVVQLLEGPLEVDGRRAILLSDAGRKTLADRLASEGRATIGQLENFGRDLLEAVAYLESRGVFHRDIKPTNLGDAPDRGTRKPRLTLFDFSLGSEPVEHMGSGTPGYLDPFLGKGRRRQYDRAAELYAVSVTLFEMAKGELPTWARGDSVPEDATDRVVVLPTMFDRAVGEQLGAFFARALHPDIAQRYSNATDLGRAWAGVFAGLDRAPGDEDAESDAAHAARDARAAAATLITPLAAAGLSARVLSALAAREDVATVGELIAVPMTRLNSIPGLGETYRRELAARVREWRERLLAGTTIVQPDEELAEGQLGVERIAEGLLPRRTAATAVEAAALTALLSLDDADHPTLSVWPTTQELATAVGASRADVEHALENATKRWRKAKRLDVPEQLITEMLTAQQGVAELAELAAALTLALGSAREGEARARVAAGVVRAVIEADSRREHPRFTARRVAGDDGALRAALIATTDPGLLLHGDAALDLTLALATAADTLVADRSLVVQGNAVVALREVAGRALEAEQAAQLDDDRLLRLATGAATRAALSSRGELYPRDLPGSEAVLLALRGTTARMMTRERARARVTGRFPAVRDVPDGPAFVELVTRAVPALRWDGERFTQVDLTTGASVTSPTVTDLHTVDAPSADRVLRASLRTHSALTLAVSPHRYTTTAAALAEQYGVHVVDVADLVVEELRAGAARHNADWDAVTALDAHPENDYYFEHLRVLGREVVPPRWAEIAARREPLLLVNAGPLARYGLTDLLAPFFDLAKARPAARWLLVARRPSDQVPTLDGHAAPLGPDGWLDVPVGLTDMKGIA